MESNRATMTSSSEPGSALTNPERWRAVLARATRTPTGASSTRCGPPGSTAGRPARRGGRAPASSPSSPTPTPPRPTASAPAGVAIPARRATATSARRAGARRVRDPRPTRRTDEPRRAVATHRLEPHHLQRVFTRVTGVSPRACADARRRGRLASPPARGPAGGRPRCSRPATDRRAASTRTAPPASGSRPPPTARAAPGRASASRVTRSPLGALLVAATARGSARCASGGSAARLEAELAPSSTRPRSSRRAAPSRGGSPPCCATSRVTRPPRRYRSTCGPPRSSVASGTRSSRSRPARHAATPTSRATWGGPGAQRAVARAIASNPVAVLIPCHRVVPRSGRDRRLSLGAERKRRLLALERSHAGTARGATIRRRARATPRPGAAAAASLPPRPSSSMRNSIASIRAPSCSTRRPAAAAVPPVASSRRRPPHAGATRQRVDAWSSSESSPYSSE